jgi:hypothetical protein
MRKSEIKQMVV